MATSIQVVTTPTAETSGTTLMLSSGSKQYFVGSMSEGLSRAAIGRIPRMTGIEQCFITGRTRWSNTGGILGIILNLAESLDAARTSHTRILRGKILNLTKSNKSSDLERIKALEAQLSDVSSTPLIIFAPPNLTYQIAAARRFIFRKGLPMKITEIRDSERETKAGEDLEPQFVDENIRVWGLSIFPSTTPGTASMPRAPRKRSYDETEAEDDELASASVQPGGETSQHSVSDNLSSEAHTKLVVEGIVAEMFNSGWQLDALYETRLDDVKLPATIFVRDAVTRKVRKYQGPLRGSSDTSYDPNLVVLVRKPWPGSLLPSLPPTTPSEAAVSYIFRCNERRGKFLPQRAVALKVPSGPKWAELSNGNPVENEDGLLINPDQVLEPSRPGNGFAIIDLPDPTYIDDLIRRPEWTSPKIMQGVQVLLWTGDLEALEDERIRSFMQSLSGVEHILFNEALTGNYIVHDHVAEQLARLNAIDGARHRPHTHSQATRQNQHGFAANTVAGSRDLVVNLEPKVEITDLRAKNAITEDNANSSTKSASQTIHPKTASKVNSAVQALEGQRQAMDRWAERVPGLDVEVVTLGTGSAVPQKARNVSSTLVRVPGWGSMLFDCGEGTLGQLRRSFSPAEFDQVIQELRMITISHLHADHHLGTVGVINEWYKQVHSSRPTPVEETSSMDGGDCKSQQRLAVLAELSMHLWLNEYAAVEDFGYSRLAPLCVKPAKLPAHNTTLLDFWPMERPASDSRSRPSKASAQVRKAEWLGLLDFQAVAVDHCIGAHAYSITWPNQFKISYSGDCRPSRDFVSIGKDSTVCVHEATFGNELAHEAVVKKHSTIGEAIAVADAMNAKICILTHFSQRYGPDTQAVRDLLENLAAERYPIKHVPGIASLQHSVESSNGTANNTQTMERIEELTQDTDMHLDLHNGLPLEIPAADAGPDLHGAEAEAIEAELTPEKPEMLSDFKTEMIVCAAIDLMRMKVGDVPEIKHFLPAIIDLHDRDEIATLKAAAITAEQAIPKNGKLKQSKADAAANAAAARTKEIRRLEIRVGDREAESDSAVHDA